EPNFRITASLYRLRKNNSFVSGYRFSDTVSPSKSNAPLGAGHRQSTFSAASSAMPQVLRNEKPWCLAENSFSGPPGGTCSTRIQPRRDDRVLLAHCQGAGHRIREDG